ncbi:unnamed protein product [Calicophoron daubneyi]|uniref:Dynactin subunit 1 n=1 Tax=Calicophoron daubneyi TaxID=300641 RepID=A0AAV2T270_CALDB
MTEFKLRPGIRVEVLGKDVVGTVAYIGTTQFSAGKWVGVTLDEPKGKNDGSVQGKRYFTCEDGYGIFVRPTQLKLLDGGDDGNLSLTASMLSESSVTSEPESTGSSGTKPPRAGSSSSLAAGQRKPTPPKGIGAAKKGTQLPTLSKGPRNSSVGPTAPAGATKLSGSTERIPSAQAPAGGSSPALAAEAQRRQSTASKLPDKATPTAEKTTPPKPGAITPKIQTPAPAEATSPSPKIPQAMSPPSQNTTVPSPKPGSPSVEIPASPVETREASSKSGVIPSPAAQKVSLPTVSPSAVKSPKSPPESTGTPSISSHPRTPISVPSPAIVPSSGGPHSPDAEIEIGNLHAEIQTLSNQLEALKAKRAEDRSRLQELERLKVQNSKLEENRRLIREQTADLQRELAQAKKDKAGIQQAFDHYKEEMAELVENMEMATLDKEMAEEKLDSLNSEMEILKEKVEELTLENQILKEESEEKAGAPSADGAPTPAQLKNLEQQNERMKEVLIKLRDLTNQDKQEITKLNKEISRLGSEVEQLTAQKERLTVELKQSADQTIELKEQVDAALGADQMVSQLTQRNLELEEQLEKLKEERNDLEALCEMNDELQENSRDTERELREEMDQANAKITQLARHLDACKETISDYERTLGKFRDAVTELQAQNAELRRSLADGERKQGVTSPVPSAEILAQPPIGSGLDFASQALTMAKVIETELRSVEAEQGKVHVARLSAFLPDSFLRRGGDNDALLALLLIERLASKADVLETHLSERYPLPACIPSQISPPAALVAAASPAADLSQSDADKQEADAVTGLNVPGSAQPLAPMTKSKAEFYSFITRLIHILRTWSALLNQYKQVLSTCSVDLYMKVGSLYFEMGAYEECIDRLIELTKKDQLDENTPLEPLVAALAYFNQLYSVHLASQPISNCSSKLFRFVQCVVSALNALATDATALSILTGQPLEPLQKAASDAAATVSGPLNTSYGAAANEAKQAPSAGGLITLLVEEVRFAAVTRVIARRIRRRIPADPSAQPLSFSAEVAGNLDKAAQMLGCVVAAMYETTRLAGQLSARQADDAINLKPAVVFSECLTEACKEKLAASKSNVSVGQPDLCIRTYLDQVRDLVAKIGVAMENGEFDFDGSKQAKPQEPVALRATAYKQAQAELEGYRARVESKEEQVRELQLAVKTKAEEVSEMSVRLGLAEKRLENAGKGNEEKVSRLEQRLEQLEAQLKREEREHGQTIDALQADIEVLERDKVELKEKLKNLSKKALMGGLIKSPMVAGASPTPPAAATTAAGPKDAAGKAVSEVPSVMTRDIGFLNSEIDALREAVRHLTADNSRLRGEKILMQMKSLKPLKRRILTRAPADGGGTPDEGKKTPDSEAPSGQSDAGKEKERAGPKPPTVSHVSNELLELQQQLYAVLAHPKVVSLQSREQKAESAKPSGAGDGSENVEKLPRAPPSAKVQLIRQADYLVKLKDHLEKLQMRARETMKQEYPQAFTRFGFENFPLPQMQQVLKSAIPGPDDPLVSRLILPNATREQTAPLKVVLHPKQLQYIHSRLLTSS